MEMECSEIDELLVEYHFAASPPARRDHVHAHLLECSPCARRYLNLKQTIEQSADLGLRPSERARTRLRAAVSLMADETRSRRAGSSSAKLAALRRFFRTPVPRYQIAAAVLLVLLGAFATRFRGPADDTRPEARPEARIDGARPFPMVVNRELPPDGPELRSQPVQLLVLPSGQRAVIDSARTQAVSLTFY